MFLTRTDRYNRHISKPWGIFRGGLQRVHIGPEMAMAKALSLASFFVPFPVHIISVFSVVTVHYILLYSFFPSAFPLLVTLAIVVNLGLTTFQVSQTQPDIQRVLRASPDNTG